MGDDVADWVKRLTARNNRRELCVVTGMWAPLVVGLAWGGLLAGLEVWTNMLLGADHGGSWRDALLRSWDWAFSGAAATAVFTAGIAHRWLRARHVAWVWVGAWLGTGVAAAAAAAIGISIERTVVLLLRGSEPSNVLGGIPFLWILVFAIALPQTILASIVSLPVVLLWRRRCCRPGVARS